jgi:hypothetical protein
MVLGICAIIVALTSLVGNIAYLSSSLGFAYRYSGIDRVLALQMYVFPIMGILGDLIMLAGGIVTLARLGAAWHIVLAYIGMLMLNALVSMGLYSARLVFRSGGISTGTLLPTTLFQTFGALGRLLFLIVILVVLTRPPVKYIFQSAVTGRSDPIQP